VDSDARTARLIAARRHSAAHKRRHTLQTVDAVRRRGDRVTFAGIAREAAVSGWFVRNQPDVRDAIERAAREHDAAGTPDKRARRTDDSTTGLRSELLLAREEIRDLRRDRDRTRQQLRADLGAELDHGSRHDLLQRIHELEQRNGELVAEHAAATALATHSAVELAIAASDLAAARAANRRFMREANSRPDPIETCHPPERTDQIGACMDSPIG
jgi:hypothetical protein